MKLVQLVSSKFQPQRITKEPLAEGVHAKLREEVFELLRANNTNPLYSMLNTQSDSIIPILGEAVASPEFNEHQKFSAVSLIGFCIEQYHSSQRAPYAIPELFKALLNENEKVNGEAQRRLNGAAWRPDQKLRELILTGFYCMMNSDEFRVLSEKNSKQYTRLVWVLNALVGIINSEMKKEATA